MAWTNDRRHFAAAGSTMKKKKKRMEGRKKAGKKRRKAAAGRRRKKWRVETDVERRGGRTTYGVAVATNGSSRLPSYGGQNLLRWRRDDRRICRYRRAGGRCACPAAAGGSTAMIGIFDAVAVCAAADAGCADASCRRPYNLVRYLRRMYNA